MNMLRDNRGWLVKFLLDPSQTPPCAAMQVVEVWRSFLRFSLCCSLLCVVMMTLADTSHQLSISQYVQYPGGETDHCIVRLSDGEHFVSAKLTAVAIQLFLDKHDRNVSDIRGACMRLQKFDRVPSPSNLEFILIVDEFVYQGGDGASPFYISTDANLVPAVRSALEEQADAQDMMLLMAKMLEHDEPLERQPSAHFPVPLSDTIIPREQRKILNALPGWTTVGDIPSQSQQVQEEYFIEGAGTQHPVSYHATSLDELLSQDVPEFQPESSPALQSSPAKAVDHGGVYNFVDGVEQSVGKMSDSSASLSLMRDDDDNDEVVVAAYDDDDEDPLSPLLPTPASRSGTASSPMVSAPHFSPSFSPVHQNKSSNNAEDDDDDDGIMDVGVYLSEEELPEFQVPPQNSDDGLAEEEPPPDSLGSAGSGCSLGNQLKWNDGQIANLCQALEQSGKNWDHAALAVGGGCTPSDCEKFFNQYYTFLPTLMNALGSFDSQEPSQKRPRTEGLDEDDDEVDLELDNESNNAGENDNVLEKVQEAEAEDEDEDEPEVYEVEAIIGERTLEDGMVEVLVKWKGWDVSDATWQAQSTCSNCHELIDRYRASIAESQAEFAIPDSPAGAKTPLLPPRQSLDVPPPTPASADEEVVPPRPEKVAKTTDSRVIPKIFQRKEAGRETGKQRRRLKSSSADSLSSRIAYDILTKKMGTNLP